MEQLGSSDRFGRQSAIDGLRGLAIALVVAFHVATDVVGGGWIGVDIFFVLSGFLITRLLLVESQKTGTVALKAFWSRRARRLLPALSVMLVVYLLVVAVLDMAGAGEASLTRTLATALAAQVYCLNWIMALEGQYDPAIGHLWSLSVEEQFYLIWPLVLVVASRRGQRAVMTVIFVGIAAAAVSGFAMDGAPGRNYFGTEIHVAELLLGACLAQLHLSGRLTAVPWSSSRWRAISASAFLLLVLLGLRIPWMSEGFLQRGGLVVYAAVTAFVVASVIMDRHGPLATLLSWRPLVVLGTRSYSLYLVHHPIERAVRHAAAPTLVRVSMSVALSLVAAEVLYRGVESRWMTKRSPRPSRSSRNVSSYTNATWQAPAREGTRWASRRLS